MKKIIITFLTIYFISNLSCFAQIGCWNNPNTTTTKWDVDGTSNTENWPAGASVVYCFCVAHLCQF